MQQEGGRPDGCVGTSRREPPWRGLPWRGGEDRRGLRLLPEFAAGPEVTLGCSCCCRVLEVDVLGPRFVVGPEFAMGLGSEVVVVAAAAGGKAA